MSKLSFIAAAVLAGSVFSAQAGQTYDLGDTLSTTGVAGPVSFQYVISQGGSVDAGTYDSVSFDLTDNAIFTLEVDKDGAAKKTGTFSLRLGSSVLATYNVTDAGGSFTTNLGAGQDYLLTFAPSSSSRGAINYTLSFSNSLAVANPPTPAVPEPEGYALALAGLAVVGLTARRRAKANA